MAADNNADDNTIQVEVIISVTSDTAVIADGSTHDFAVAVNYGTATVNPTVETFTAVHDQSSINEVSCGHWSLCNCQRRTFFTLHLLHPHHFSPCVCEFARPN